MPAFFLIVDLYPATNPGLSKNLKKYTALKFFIFLGSKTTIYLSLGVHVQVTKEAFSSEKRTPQNLKFLNFFLILWIIFALLDPDLATQINADPDPQPPVAMHWCSPDIGLRAAQGSPAQPAGAGGGEGAGKDGGRPPADEEVHRGNERDQSAAGAGTVLPCSDHARYQCCGSALVSLRFRIQIGIQHFFINARPDLDPDPRF